MRLASWVSIPAFLKMISRSKSVSFSTEFSKLMEMAWRAEPSPKALEVENWETMDISGQQVSIMVWSRFSK